MEAKNAIFIKGIRGTDDILKSDFLELAFYGRSNVGKSSSINAILGKKNLVKSSATPGKTKEINFFEVEQKFYIVDLPGYGYAKISEKEREKIRKLIRWYLFDSGVKNRINILVLDSRVGITDLDKEMLKAFLAVGEEVILLMNKIDKLNQKELSKKFKELKKKIGDNIKIIKFSATKKKGIKEFWNLMDLK